MARSSTTYPRKWKSGKTTVIRIPEVLANDLLGMAHKMDAADAYCLREEPGVFVLEYGESCPVQYTIDKPINVAAVPHRSPFRYPGGKTWLVPYIRDWLRSAPSRPARLIEPFAGGAIISLTAAFERLAKHVIFAELDENVASVWQVVLNGQADWLAERILSFELTTQSAREVLSSKAKGLRERSFQTILRNRVQRGGIMAPGAGLVKQGEAGRGINSRWYPSTLARRIREINRMKDRITFIEGDGLKVISEYKNDENAAFYIDPPYTLAARRLYSKWHVDHEKLFARMKECRGDFLMSYDNTPEIVRLAGEFGFQTQAIAMKNAHHAKMTELLIGRDLSWLDER